jgi:hypothetical protein
VNARIQPRRDPGEQRRRRQLLGVPELRVIEPETSADSTLEFLVLCEFIAGFSIEQAATQFRISSDHAEKLIRSALLQYGFHAVRGK